MCVTIIPSPLKAAIEEIFGTMCLSVADLGSTSGQTSGYTTTRRIIRRTISERYGKDGSTCTRTLKRLSVRALYSYPEGSRGMGTKKTTMKTMR